MKLVAAGYEIKFITPNATTVNRIANIEMKTVDIISTFGKTFLTSLISSARNVAVSHPKNVSAMKNIAKNIADAGKTKNGVKFAVLIWKKPGTIKTNKTNKVATPKNINILELCFIPL